LKGLKKRKNFFGRRVGGKEKVATFALPIRRNGEKERLEEVKHAAGGGRG